MKLGPKSQVNLKVKSKVKLSLLKSIVERIALLS